MLDWVLKSQMRELSSMWKKGKFCGSYRPSLTTQIVMPTVAPVPMAAMRNGRESDAPGAVTRTGRIAWTPEPPPERRALFDLPMGKTIKCQLFYDARWWYASNGLKYDGYVGGAEFPICWVMDNTPPEGAVAGPFVLMTFTVGAQVDKLGTNPTDAHIQQVVLDALVFLFQDERARQIDRIVIHRWVPADPFVGGGPNTVFTPGVLTGAPGRLLGSSVPSVW